MSNKKIIRIQIFDPPSGWQYGFPAALPTGMSYEKLLKEKGYPENMMELAMKHSRSWYEEIEVDDD